MAKNPFSPRRVSDSMNVGNPQYDVEPVSGGTAGDPPRTRRGARHSIGARVIPANYGARASGSRCRPFH
jgi:hypothetical protein